VVDLKGTFTSLGSMYGFRIGAKTVFVSVDGSGAADDAVTDGAEIAADAQPGLQGDAEIAFESAFREVSGGA